MPKQVLKLDQFHGGLNDSADPRDIDDNQLAKAGGISISNIGKIQLIGNSFNHEANSGNPAQGMPPGCGLFVFRHDHRGAGSPKMPWLQELDNQDNIKPEGDVYIFSTNGKSAKPRIYSLEESDWAASTWDSWYPRTNNGNANWLPDQIFFIAGGNIRMIDTDFKNLYDVSEYGNGSKYMTSWYGFIHRDRWTGAGEPYSVANTGGLGFNVIGGWYKKDTFCYRPEHSDGSEDTIGTIMDKESTDQFVLTSLFNWESGSSHAGTNQFTLCVNSNKTLEGGWRGFKKYYMSYIYDGTQESELSAFGDKDEAWEDSKKKFKLCHKVKGHWNDFYNDGITYQEQYPLNYRITGGRIYFRDVSSAGEPYGDAILLFDFDLRDGVRKIGSKEWLPWEEENVNERAIESPGGSDWLLFNEEPTGPTYDAMSGIKFGEFSTYCTYKTATILNNRLYAGNIAHLDSNHPRGEVEHWRFRPDAMVKSPPQAYDILPISNIIEASVGDGDEITCLENYADRILQFKMYKMHIINCAEQENEFLEDTHMYKGVWSPAAVCKTDFGIAWVNKHGCYLYDGKQVKNLLEKKGKRLIKESTWNTFIPEVSNSYDEAKGKLGAPMIGYLPKERKLLVLDSCYNHDGEIYMYNIITEGWVRHFNRLNVGYQISGFQNDWNGDLYWRYATGSAGSDKYWSETPSTSTVSFRTKDIDFGLPAVRKKIYKVYVTYKGTSLSTLYVRYAVNGENVQSAMYEFNSDTTPLADHSDASKWAVAELTPTTSSEANNIYSIAVDFYSASSIDSNFEINDISFVYRVKNIK